MHTGARAAALAALSEVLVSSTVKDLVAGSGIEFDERGEHELKGVPGTRRLYAVCSGDAPRAKWGGQYRLPGRGRRAVRPHLGAGLDLQRRSELGDTRVRALPRSACILLPTDPLRSAGLASPTPLPSIACLHWSSAWTTSAPSSTPPDLIGRLVRRIRGRKSQRLFAATYPAAFGRSSCSQHSPSGYGARIIPGHRPRDRDRLIRETEDAWGTPDAVAPIAAGSSQEQLERFATFFRPAPVQERRLRSGA